jgi:hypothetical protein
VGEWPVADTPLTDKSVNASAETMGATNSTISCVDATNTTIASGGPGDPASGSATGLTPGTYACTIVIDP